MELKEFLIQNRIKLGFLIFVLVSFAAGFALSGLTHGNIQAYLNNTPKAAAEQYAAGTDSCQIKGKPTKAGKKIYYYPGSLFYNKVKNPQCFSSEAEAQAAGFTRSAH